jgi:intracellular sulfur oxidation DsrE/DsrF family protein
MVIRCCSTLVVLMVFGSQVLLSQSKDVSLIPTPGPLVDPYGKVYDVPKAVPLTRSDRIYRVVFDVSRSPKDLEQVNTSIETLARFLNMHVRNGIPAGNLQLALVLHGTAAKDALSHEAYRARFGVENPNFELLQSLADAGVQGFLCGQTAKDQGIEGADLIRPVKIALSAMTALVVLQEEGYRLIPW